MARLSQSTTMWPRHSLTEMLDVGRPRTRLWTRCIEWYWPTSHCASGQPQCSIHCQASEVLWMRPAIFTMLRSELIRGLCAHCPGSQAVEDLPPGSRIFSSVLKYPRDCAWMHPTVQCTVLFTWHVPLIWSPPYQLPVVAGQVAYTQLCLRLFAGKSWNTEGWCSRWDSTMLPLICAASLVPMFRGNIRWYAREWRRLYILKTI